MVKGFINEFKPVTGNNCKPKSRQIAEVMQLLLRCQFTPDEYYYYRFYELDKDYRDILKYISNFYIVNYYRPALNDQKWAVVFRNKLIFNRYFSSFGLPLARAYGFYETKTGFTWEGLPLTSPDELKSMIDLLRPKTMVVKPVGGSCGKNIIVLAALDYSKSELECETVDGSKLSFSDLVYHLHQQTVSSPFKGFLLEEKVEQHKEISRISPFLLNTARVFTLLDKNNNVIVPFACIKFGRKGASVDNTARGGFYIYVEPADGEMGVGIYRKDGKNIFINEHPDTGAKFKGHYIPFWNETLKICKKAARLAPFCRSVAWDVAITPDGPLLIEGNDDHSAEIQTLFNGYMQPGVREVLSYYGLNLPENKLPKFRLHRFLQALKMWSKKN